MSGTRKVNPKKLETAKRITEQLGQYKVIGVLNLRGMPSSQMQKMRASLRGNAEILMAKRRIMQKAIEAGKGSKKGIEGIAPFVIDQPALIFSNLNPFKLYAQLEKSKAPSAAKGGEIAPNDIIIPKGETPFAPGPMLGELQKSGLKAAVEGGKITIKEDKIVCKAGEKIPEKIVGILSKLDIKPLTIGLNLVAAFEDGMIYGKDILAVDQKQYIANIQTAYRNSIGLSVEIGYPTKKNIDKLLAKAYRNTKAVAMDSGFPTKDTIGELLAKAQAEMLAVISQIKDDAALDEDLKGRATQGAAAPAQKEEPKKEEKKAEEAAAGLGALFG